MNPYRANLIFDQPWKHWDTSGGLNHDFLKVYDVGQASKSTLRASELGRLAGVWVVFGWVMAPKAPQARGLWTLFELKNCCFAS